MASNMRISQLIDKFNHGISFAELAAIGRCGEVCVPGEDDGESEKNCEGGEGVGDFVS